MSGVARLNQHGFSKEAANTLGSKTIVIKIT
jgi:hypothetical protein